MSDIFVDNIKHQSSQGSGTITLGTSGETIALASGASVTGNGLVGITQADLWRLTSNLSSSSTNTVIASNLERADDASSGLIGSGMSQSSGIFTFPQTGIYDVTFSAQYYYAGDSRYITATIEVTTDNSNYDRVTQNLAHIEQSYSIAHQNVTASALIDVTDTSNVKVRFVYSSDSSTNLNSDTDFNLTYMKFIRLGDT